MAEVQKNTATGELNLRFIEFVRMHAQNTSLFLGRIPHPQTGKPQVNLEVARMLVEQLAAIQFKTRGNLTSDEEEVLKNALSNLQEGLVEAVDAARRPQNPASSATQWQAVGNPPKTT